jgi:hypothetical protein
MRLAIRRSSALCCAAAALAATAIAASPAAAAPAAAPGSTSSCPSVPTVEPFAPWQDVADYVLAPDGGAEAGGAAWTLEGGAGVVEGNETFAAGGPGDHRSLDLPAGSTATTAPMCIGIEDRTMRFFLNGPATGQLSVQAIYTAANGRETAVPLATAGGSGTWAPSAVVPMRVNELAAQSGGALQVALRFTPRGNSGWQIDDVFVDPYRMR